MNSRKLSDILIMIIHICFIILTFLVAIFAPFYISGLFIFFHWLHEKISGDCILTMMQRKYGFIEKDEDFFHYLFKKIKLPLNSKVTMNMHYAVKTIVLIIILFDLFQFLT